MNRALIIFAREPVPGQAKTRMGQSIGNQAAADLYAAMLRDVLNTVANLPEMTPMIFWADTEFPKNMGDLENGFTSYLQAGNDLGERMACAFDTAFSLGFEHCCIIGSDAPDLPPEYILQAFELLENNSVDVVFGPATDGGYYLAGMNKTYLQLFDGIPWSSRETLDKSCAKATALGISYALLPEWHDIDTLEDAILAFRMGLATASNTRKALEHLLPHTFKSEGDIQA